MFVLWAPVEENPKYSVSTRGAVRGPRGILKGMKDKDGYIRVALCEDNTKKFRSVHQLVSKAFINNPHGYTCVNHKNEDKTDNRIENLEWCTVEYNNSYGTRLDRWKKSLGYC